MICGRLASRIDFDSSIRLQHVKQNHNKVEYSSATLPSDAIKISTDVTSLPPDQTLLIFRDSVNPATNGTTPENYVSGVHIMLVLVFEHSYKTLKRQATLRMYDLAVERLIKVHFSMHRGAQSNADAYREVYIFGIHQSEVWRNDIQPRRFE